MFRDIKRGVSFGITSLQTTSQSRGAPAIKVKLGNELQTFVIYFFNTSVKLPWHWPFLVAMALAITSRLLAGQEGREKLNSVPVTQHFSSRSWHVTDP